MSKVVGLLALAALAGSCVGLPHQHVVPAPDTRAAEPSQARSDPAARDTSKMCVLQNGRVRLLQGDRNAILASDPSAGVYSRVPPPYADSAAWFVARDTIVVSGRTFVWNGSAIAPHPHEVRQVGMYRGIALFALSEFAHEAEQSILLVPVAPGCEFQPYYYFRDTGPARPDR